MTDLKQTKFYSTEDFKAKLKALCEKHNISQSSFIVDAIAEKAKRDYDEDLGVASAPHGVRSDALPLGWKSRLYRDRYQLVAVITELGIEMVHLHEYDGEISGYTTHRTDTPEPVEIYAPKEINSLSLQLAYLDFLNTV